MSQDPEWTKKNVIVNGGLGSINIGPDAAFGEVEAIRGEVP